MVTLGRGRLISLVICSFVQTAHSWTRMRISREVVNLVKVTETSGGLSFSTTDIMSENIRVEEC